MKAGDLTSPAPLSSEHVLDNFHCTDASLDRWLKERARKNEGRASRTYVVCDGKEVVGYYCLSTGGVAHSQVPGRLRRNMPEPIPVLVLGRLAVHEKWARQGIGRGLLKDAVTRSLKVATEIGTRALLCHAVSEDAKKFYLKYGFVESPIDPMTVMLPLGD